MPWKPIVVGVDASPEAADAVRFAVETAQPAATTCHLVHATDDAGQTRAQVVAALESRVPQAILGKITITCGPPAAVLSGAVAAFGAELVVLGGKRHATLDRWLGGSTSLAVARTTGVPLLVTAGMPALRRVLVAGDLSAAARPA